MQYIAIPDAVVSQLLKAGAVKRNIRILLYIPIQPGAAFLQPLPEQGTEFLLDPGKGLIQSAGLQRTLVNAQVKSPDAVELHFYQSH